LKIILTQLRGGRPPSPLPPRLPASRHVVFITGSGLTTAQERPLFRYRDTAP